MTGGDDVRNAHLGDLLSALLDGELPPSAEAAARAHLAGCEACAAELDATRAVRLAVRALPAVEPPFGFYERMRPSSRPWWRDHRRTVAAALAGSAAASALFLGASSAPQQPVSPSVATLIEAHATSASVSGDVLSTLTPAGVPVSLGR
ncbi:MAG: zf-HC2 domain-containing protein [Actinomycetota bacterium]|nr:zf-HC2 domain-containing protein [Actinomycetota bacterium]